MGRVYLQLISSSCSGILHFLGQKLILFKEHRLLVVTFSVALILISEIKCLDSKTCCIEAVVVDMKQLMQTSTNYELIQVFSISFSLDNLST